MRVGANDQPHVLQAEAGPLEGQLELAQRAWLVQAGIDEHDSVAGGDGVGVAVRDARPRKRQPQAPQAGKNAVRPRELSPA
jgi:hypothetical protein